MNPEGMGRLFVFLLGMVAVLYAMYGPYQRMIVDWLRGEIFDIRDRLFILAATGRIDIDSAEYQAAREHLNAVIQYAHHMTLQRALIIFAAKMVSRDSVGNTSNFSEIISRIEVNSPELRAELDSYPVRVTVAIASAFLFRSFFALFATLAAIPFFALAHLYKNKSREKLVKAVDIVVNYEIREGATGFPAAA